MAVTGWVLDKSAAARAADPLIEVIAETALHHGMGVVHVDGDFDRIAQVRPLVVRRLPSSL